MPHSAECWSFLLIFYCFHLYSLSLLLGRLSWRYCFEGSLCCSLINNSHIGGGVNTRVPFCGCKDFCPWSTTFLLSSPPAAAWNGLQNLPLGIPSPDHTGTLVSNQSVDLVLLSSCCTTLKLVILTEFRAKLYSDFSSAFRVRLCNESAWPLLKLASVEIPRVPSFPN